MNTNNFAQEKISMVTLANVGEIVSGVIKEIAGNDISNSLNGSVVTSNVIQTLAYQRINSQLNSQKA